MQEIPGALTKFTLASGWTSFSNAMENVIHGCIDGFSWRKLFLKCNANNKTETVLKLFVENFGLREYE